MKYFRRNRLLSLPTRPTLVTGSPCFWAKLDWARALNNQTFKQKRRIARKNSMIRKNRIQREFKEFKNSPTTTAARKLESARVLNNQVFKIFARIARQNRAILKNRIQVEFKLIKLSGMTGSGGDCV